MTGAFRLTYSTMFDPPPALHARFEAAVELARGSLGRTHAMRIDGADVAADSTFELRAPADRRVVLGRFALGDARHSRAAFAAAARAYPRWAATPWRERVAILRRAAALIEARVFEIGAVLALEVGKNRMESLGEAQETADLIAYACDRMEACDGFVAPMARDPLPGFVSENASVLKPHGPWLVIAPFNFPLALAGGPAGAALVAGNAVVCKSASATPWSGALLAQALADAGVPAGAFNYVTGPGATLGAALVDDEALAGVTFTGSHDVGMALYRRMAAGRYSRPCIAEMGGKNAAIVSRHADVADAVTGIARSAFGLSGQKCSACSRVFVESAVADALIEQLGAASAAIGVGDPTLRENWMGPVIDDAAAARYAHAVARARTAGSIVCGGSRYDDDLRRHGHFVAPTVARVPPDDALWRDELFVPFVLVAPVDGVDEGIARANASDYGLTAGFYGAPDETERFFATIEAGVAYANRPQGATTGAWPGYQPFGGWKASGSTGKAGGSLYYVQQYLREQSQTRVRRAS